jgi:hypothetical protein
LWESIDAHGPGMLLALDTRIQIPCAKLYLVKQAKGRKRIARVCQRKESLGRRRSISPELRQPIHITVELISVTVSDTCYAMRLWTNCSVRVLPHRPR